MLRPAVVWLVLLSSSAFAQSFPEQNRGSAIAAKDARVSLTADGPWLATPVAPKTFLTIYDDAGARPRFGEDIRGARLLLYVDRDALQTMLTTTAFVQASENAGPGKDAAGYTGRSGDALEVLSPEANGLVNVRIKTDELEVTGFVAATSIGTTFRYDTTASAPFTPDASLPTSFELLDKPKGTSFARVKAADIVDAKVLKRSAGFTLVRIEQNLVGWIATKKVGKRAFHDVLGEEGGEEGGVAGGVLGGATTRPVLVNGTPLFDKIGGAFVGVTSFLDAKPVETKGDWMRFSLTTPYGAVSVWASRTIGPPPPAPPAPGAMTVAPALLEGSRIAGNKMLAPDDDTKRAIAAANKSKVIGTWKLCIDRSGTITVIQQLKSTGFPAYDKTIAAGMAQWRYKPYEYNGKAIPVCTAITFIYSQK